MRVSVQSFAAFSIFCFYGDSRSIIPAEKSWRQNREIKDL